MPLDCSLLKTFSQAGFRFFQCPPRHRWFILQLNRTADNYSFGDRADNPIESRVFEQGHYDINLGYNFTPAGD